MIFIDAATLSLNGGAKPVEVYQPIWFANGTSAYTGTYGYLQNGSALIATIINASCTLFTLSSSFSATMNFAFEATFLAGSASSWCELYDVTTSTLLASTQIQTTSTVFSTFRSSKFTLTPGHSYAVYINNTGGTSSSITDASLIIFP